MLRFFAPGALILALLTGSPAFAFSREPLADFLNLFSYQAVPRHTGVTIGHRGLAAIMSPTSPVLAASWSTMRKAPTPA
jgi:hypothetical protein